MSSQELRGWVPWTVIILLAALFVGETVVTVVVYVFPGQELLALLSAVGSILVLATVDTLVRPHEAKLEGTWFRRYLPAWCFVPFVCALLGSAWMHYQERQAALDDIRKLTVDMNTLVGDKAKWSSLGSLNVYAVVETMARARFPHESVAKPREEANSGSGSGSGSGETSKPKSPPRTKRSEERERFIELARVIGEDLRHANGNVDQVMHDFEADTLSGFLLAIGLQSLLVLWFPALLAVSVRASLNRLEQGKGDPENKNRWAVYVRDLGIVAETRATFVPRLFFAMILLLGTNYLMSPLGVRATYVMGIIEEHGLPGQTSWSLWSTDFTDAPVVTIGFVGYLLYAIIIATQRFLMRDLDDRSLLALLVRGVVVLLLSLALGATSMNDTLARTFVFMAGVFPIRALEALAKRVNIAMDPDFGTANSNAFDGIPFLDPAKVFAMRAAGIESVSDLATMRMADIAERVRIDLRLLGRVIDRAVLVDSIGLDLAKALEPLGVTSATELVALDKPSLDRVCEKLQTEAPRLVAQRLDGDARLAELQVWVDDPNTIKQVERNQAKVCRLEQLPRIDALVRGIVSDHTAATRLHDALAKTEFLVIELGEFGLPRVELPYASYSDFGELVDDIAYLLREKIHAYQYGREWAIQVGNASESVRHARQILRSGTGRPIDDRRPLTKLGIHPGNVLKIRKLEP